MNQLIHGVHALYMANFDEIRKSSRAIFHEKADSYESAKNYMHRTSIISYINIYNGVLAF